MEYWLYRSDKLTYPQIKKRVKNGKAAITLYMAWGIVFSLLFVLTLVIQDGLFWIFKIKE